MTLKSYSLNFKNIPFFLNFGFSKSELETGQRLYFDLSFHLDPEKFECKDDIHSVYDYSHVHNDLETTIRKRQFRLLEDLARQIAEQFLTDKRILQLDLSIRKPSVPIQAILDHVELNMSFVND